MATEQYIEQAIALLLKSKLFYGIGRKSIPGLLSCIHAAPTNYQKGAWIIREGEAVSSFGIVLSGSGRAVREDAEGRAVIITLLAPLSEIGVILAASRGHRSPVSVQALEDMTMLRVPFAAMTARCSQGCDAHDRLLRNYIGIVAEKGLVLHERIDCLLKPTVREKILAYLNRLALASGGREIDIPMDRAAMAEYLNVDRSALSRELSRMKKERLIDFCKNSFRILTDSK